MIKLLNKYLPTKVSQITAIVILPIATSGYFIIESLSPLLSFWQKETIVILQVAVFLLLSLIGVFTIAISLIHFVNTRDINITINRNPPVNDKSTNTTRKDQIIEFLEVGPSTAMRISSGTGMHESYTRTALNDLLKENIVVKRTLNNRDIWGLKHNKSFKL